MDFSAFSQAAMIFSIEGLAASSLSDQEVKSKFFDFGSPPLEATPAPDGAQAPSAPTPAAPSAPMPSMRSAPRLLMPEVVMISPWGSVREGRWRGPSGPWVSS
ncbi:hypothetical protein SGRI78S_03030 [Streptomyces griseus subsp. griseus]